MLGDGARIRELRCHVQGETDFLPDWEGNIHKALEHEQRLSRVERLFFCFFWWRKLYDAVCNRVNIQLQNFSTTSLSHLLVRRLTCMYDEYIYILSNYVTAEKNVFFEFSFMDLHRYVTRFCLVLRERNSLFGIYIYIYISYVHTSSFSYAFWGN